jgi:hypothetical protein
VYTVLNAMHTTKHNCTGSTTVHMLATATAHTALHEALQLALQPPASQQARA